MDNVHSWVDTNFLHCRLSLSKSIHSESIHWKCKKAKIKRKCHIQIEASPFSINKWLLWLLSEPCKSSAATRRGYPEILPHQACRGHLHFSKAAQNIVPYPKRARYHLERGYVRYFPGCNSPMFFPYSWKNRLK